MGRGGVAARMLQSQFYEELKTVYSELTLVQRDLFCKFLRQQIAAIRSLGSVVFWAMIREICTNPDIKTGADAKVFIKRKRASQGGHGAKRMKSVCFV